MASGTIEVAPLAYMRGRPLNDAFIILDEAQNTTAEQMKMFLTRLGFGSKMVVTGRRHPGRPAGRHHDRGCASCATSSPTSTTSTSASSPAADVVRHKLVADIVDAYGASEAKEQAAREAEDHGRHTPRHLAGGANRP
jgi:phosphate starvation-inducible PhoH-like protein